MKGIFKIEQAGKVIDIDINKMPKIDNPLMRIGQRRFTLKHKYTDDSRYPIAESKTLHIVMDPEDTEAFEMLDTLARIHKAHIILK